MYNMGACILMGVRTFMWVCVCVCVHVCMYAVCVYTYVYVYVFMGFPGGSSGKEPACQSESCREENLISGLGRSLAAGNGYPTSVLVWKIP